MYYNNKQAQTHHFFTLNINMNTKNSNYAKQKIIETYTANNI